MAGKGRGWIEADERLPATERRAEERGNPPAVRRAFRPAAAGDVPQSGLTIPAPVGKAVWSSLDQDHFSLVVVSVWLTFVMAPSVL